MKGSFFAKLAFLPFNFWLNKQFYPQYFDWPHRPFPWSSAAASFAAFQYSSKQSFWANHNVAPQPPALFANLFNSHKSC